MRNQRKSVGLALESLETRRLLTVSVVDLDLDGDMDVLANQGAGWFENVDGQFVRQESVPPTDSNYILADIDGNGAEDVVTHTSWYELVDGAFVEHPYAADIPRWASLKAIDLGADGDFDIITQSMVFENLGGTLSPPVPLDIPLLYKHWGIDPFDFDLDGDLDFLVLQGVGDDYEVDLSWYLNDGDGGFSKRTVTEYAAAPHNIGYRTNELIDIDGDGDLDLYEVSSSDHTGSWVASWFENIETDQTWPRHTVKFKTHGDATSVTVWKMHDSDRDGDLDAILWDGSQLENTADGFVPCCKIQMVSFEMNAFEKGFGDVNHDGVIDLISIRNQELFWYDGTVVSDEIQIAKVVEAMGARNGAANIDVAGDGTVDKADYRHLIEDVLEYPWGDSNFDFVFDTSDIVAAFRAGEYNDGISNNSTWAEGDWNGDREFDSSDLVWVFQAGAYSQPRRIAGHSVVASSPDFEDLDVLFDNDLETRLHLWRGDGDQTFTIRFDFDRAYDLQEIRLRHGLGEAFFPGFPSAWVAPIRKPIEIQYYGSRGEALQTQTLVPDPERLMHNFFTGYEYEAFTVDPMSGVSGIELTLEGCEELQNCLWPPGLHDVILIGRISDG